MARAPLIPEGNIWRWLADKYDRDVRPQRNVCGELYWLNGQSMVRKDGIIDDRLTMKMQTRMDLFLPVYRRTGRGRTSVPLGFMYSNRRDTSALRATACGLLAAMADE